MNKNLTTTTKTALIKQFNKAHGRFIEAATASAPQMVQAINESRECGILLKELLGRENVTENSLREFLRVNPGQLAEEQTAWLMNFVRVSNKLQGELKLFADASREVVQMTWQCAGLLPAPSERDSAQVSRELTPSVTAWKLCSDLKVKFDAMFKTAPQWDDDTRAAVRATIHKLRAWLDEIEKRITNVSRP